MINLQSAGQKGARRLASQYALCGSARRRRARDKRTNLSAKRALKILAAEAIHNHSQNEAAVVPMLLTLLTHRTVAVAVRPLTLTRVVASR
jgi:hypothetical protein